nr:ABC transporter substrate-binding protein [Chelatococcus asaccharovorans]
MKSLVFAVLLCAFSGHLAAAQDIAVAVPVEAASIDPNYAVQPHTATISLHIFDALIRRSLDGKLEPGLATSWTSIGDKTWEFKLRDGVTFQDGSPLTADDVVATVKRIGSLPSPLLRFTFYTGKIANAVAVDPTTVRFETTEPDPVLPTKLSFVYIVKKECEAVPTEEFVKSCMVGTGAYSFVKQIPGESIEVARYDGHWAGTGGFDKITFRVMANGSARTAAILGGDIDVNSRQDSIDIRRVEDDKCCSVFTAGEDRNISIAFNFSPAATGFAKKDGSPLTVNPFLDLRVRQAVALAIDSNAIVSRILDNVAVREGQPYPSEYPGGSANLPPIEPNLAKARQLMAEAGYPNGFQTRMICTSGAQVRDVDICQAVASMSAQLGIAVTIEALPANLYSVERAKGNFGMAYWTVGTGMGELLNAALFSIHTPNKERAYGGVNYTGYSNPDVDALLEKASVTFDEQTRYGLVAKAIETAMADRVVVPIARQMIISSVRGDLRYSPRADGMFNALHLVKGK